MLIVCAPAGFEGYIEELAAALAQQAPGPPDVETIQPLMVHLWHKYGIEPAG